MAEFASPVDAVEASINIQKEVEKNIQDTNDNIKIEWRMGVNLGDIMIQDNNLYGDNVNIAARLESIAQPGEVCISEKVFHEVNNKVDVKFKYFGEKKLKNISQKVKVYTSSLNSSDDVKNKSIFLNITYLSIFTVFIFCLVGGYLIYTNFFNEDLNYSSNTKSVLEDFKNSTEEDLSKNNLVADGKIAISFMMIQNQSVTLAQEDLQYIQNIISTELAIGDKIVVVSSPSGAENLNPPEVMLIATEANASFIINGIVNKEANNNFLNVKIYESKRGSLIINEKLPLDKADNYTQLLNFFSSFKKDIIN